MREQTIQTGVTETLNRRTNLLAPSLLLVVLSPILVELLMGAVTISRIWLLLPEMGVYGVGALLIRELVRRQGRGWGSMLLLGMAFAIFEEWILLQTSLTPQFFPPAHALNFGWAFGVQWIYFVAMLGYESVYAIVLPIYLTEMILPAYCSELWLDRRGIVVAGVIFILSSIGVWWLWSNVGLQRYGPTTYQVPPLYFLAAAAAVLVIVAAVLLIRLPARSRVSATRRARSPWLVGVLAFLFGLFWFLLIIFAYVPAVTFNRASPLIPIGLWLAVGILALLVVRRLSTAQGWGDRQRLALIFGALLASMLGGVLVVISAGPLDLFGKLALDLIAIVLFIWFGMQLRRRTLAAAA